MIYCLVIRHVVRCVKEPVVLCAMACTFVESSICKAEFTRPLGYRDFYAGAGDHLKVGM